jgi:Strictosidine synthase-like, N-terminal
MSIQVTDLVPIGHGIERPEHVVVTSDGRLFASDKGSAVAEILGKNRIRRIGNAGGEPNGIAIDHRGHFLIANFGSVVLQEDLDPTSGGINVLLSGDPQLQLCEVDSPMRKVEN